MSSAGSSAQTGLESLQTGAVGTTSPLENTCPVLRYCQLGEGLEGS